MGQIKRSALVSFSAEQMYNLVNDICAYPEFLPGCVGSKILAQQGDCLTASVDVSKAGISKTFTTQNHCFEAKKIEMNLIDGPFKKLFGGWHFLALDESACKITFELDFEFSSKLVELAFGKIFKDLGNNMVDAFTQRAKEVYGE